MVYISLFIVQGEQPLQCQDSGQTESDCSVQEGLYRSHVMKETPYSLIMMMQVTN